MTLPSNIAVYNSVQLIDLDAIEPLVATRQRHWTLRAWTLLEEVERRWTMFEWATFVVNEPGRCGLLFRDLASAYLFSYEATFQVLKEERPANDRNWLESSVPQYDLACRGLRALRNTGAHVRQVPVGRDHHRSIASRFANSVTGGTTAWAWTALTQGDLDALDTHHLRAADLIAWNTVSGELLALGLMRHGVTALRAILDAVEPAPGA
jgi:hypothetical protein